MTTREFIQHLILNCELDDPVLIEVLIPDGISRGYHSFEPTHASRIGIEDKPETLIECKQIKEDN